LEMRNRQRMLRVIALQVRANPSGTVREHAASVGTFLACYVPRPFTEPSL
jgi:hypothetical protein